MTTATIELYEYSDLIKPENRNVLNNVIDKWEFDSFYSEEFQNCVEDFCKEFGFSTGRKYSDITFSMNYHIEGLRLRTWIINNFKLYKSKRFYTKSFRKYRKSKIQLEKNDINGIGYTLDLVDVILEFLKNPTDMDDLCKDIGRKIDKTFDDIEDFVQSEEHILNMIEANGYKFEEDGEMY